MNLVLGWFIHHQVYYMWDKKQFKVPPFKLKNKCLNILNCNGCGKSGKVKLRFICLTSQNYKSIKRALQKIILELLKRSLV